MGVATRLMLTAWVVVGLCADCPLLSAGNTTLGSPPGLGPAAKGALEPPALPESGSGRDVVIRVEGGMLKVRVNRALPGSSAGNQGPLPGSGTPAAPGTLDKQPIRYPLPGSANSNLGVLKDADDVQRAARKPNAKSVRRDTGGKNESTLYCVFTTPWLLTAMLLMTGAALATLMRLGSRR